MLFKDILDRSMDSCMRAWYMISEYFLIGLMPARRTSGGGLLRITPVKIRSVKESMRYISSGIYATEEFDMSKCLNLVHVNNFRVILLNGLLEMSKCSRNVHGNWSGKSDIKLKDTRRVFKFSASNSPSGPVRRLFERFKRSNLVSSRSSLTQDILLKDASNSIKLEKSHASKSSSKNELERIDNAVKWLITFKTSGNQPSIFSGGSKKAPCPQQK